jgi:uncharacterized membrane protein (UPF0182 family)
MTFRMPPGAPNLPKMPRVSRGPRWALPSVVTLAVLAIILAVTTNLYTELLWYRSVDFSGVFTTRLRTQLLLFLLFGTVTGILVAANVVVAYRLRPAFRPLSPEQQGLERYRLALGPYRRIAVIGVGALFALMAGSSAAARWQTWLLWRNAVPFGKTDPQFGRDISYFTFTYPFQRFILGFCFFVVVLSLLAAAATHYLYGGLRLQTPGDKLTSGARAHLSVLLGVFVLLKAVAYWLDRYGLSFSTRGFVDTGASYTDINAVLPAKTILVVVAVICAVLFFGAPFSRGWLLPGAGLGLLVFSALVVGGVYPAVVQQLQVKPSEVDKERPYIERHIGATRDAYALRPGRDVVTTPHPGQVTGDLGRLRADTATLGNIRLLDPNQLQDTWQQLQGLTVFYKFPDTLDVDRYRLGGQEVEQVVAVRDIDTSGITGARRNWINEHLVFTHGYGLVAAPSDSVDPDGRPRFSERDIPTRGSLGLKQPRVYFGENSPTYSIVGAPRGAPARELDYPINAGSGQENFTYDGEGGIAIGSPLRRALYTLKFKEKNLLLSSGVNAQSRILYIRQPRDRVAKVAPWLTLDGDAYPAVVDGRIKWILDGYTTSNGYPYSERTTLRDATDDTLARTSASVAAQKQAQVNYIRNSVKAVVDGYDGSVSLYQWDTQDPVLKTWMKAFPGSVEPKGEMPSELRAHVRYPEDLFKVQRTLLTRFHVSDPRTFYNKSDFWRVPADPGETTARTDQPPYYLTFAMPGETSPSFRITSALLANNGKNLSAFVAVDSDPASSSYGRMRVLRLPSNATVDGPGQVANNFESDPEASKELTLLRGGGSQTIEGNLLTLPLGGGMLYVEPVYVRSKGAQSFPTLKRVFAQFNGRVSLKPTLDEALDEVFGRAGETGPDVPPPASGAGGVSAAVAQAVADANRAYADGQAALKAGDFTAYGEAQKRLAAALARLQSLSRQSSPSPSASPAPAPSPAATRPVSPSASPSS